MQPITFEVEQFSGPLDLLLALLQKNKMNIYEIRILELIDQYVAVVNAGTPGLDEASEFIEMAARLVHMKSVLLLPKSEEAERVRAELTGLLIEYSACKEIAAQLRKMGEGLYSYVRAPKELLTPPVYSVTHPPQVLCDAYIATFGRAVKKPPEPELFEPLVSRPVVSVTSRILYLLRGLTKGQFNKLKQLFNKNGSKSEAVATFLALLELMRGGRITISEKEELNMRRTRPGGE